MQDKKQSKQDQMEKCLGTKKNTIYMCGGCVVIAKF